MKVRHFSTTLILLFWLMPIFSQNSVEELNQSIKVSNANYKFSVFTTWLSFSNFGNPKTNTHHYEILAGYQITPKDRIGMKVATWKLFAPMGIPLWDSNFLKESTFYPGRLQETGVGLTYQRRLWKGLFATIEVLPLFKTYLDAENKKVGKGFKLYTTYHLGYHIPLFKKDRFFIEPQIHLNHWTIDTNTPEAFKEKEVGTNKYFFFEPNIYLGFKF